MINSRLLIFTIFFLFLASCDRRSEDFNVIQTKSLFDYYTIEVFDNRIYAAGGDVWNHSDLSTSIDGRLWQTKYFTNRAIFDLNGTDTELLAVGTSGYLFTGKEEFIKKEISTTNLFRGITKTNEGFIIVAGKDFNKGWIHIFDQEYKALNEFKYDHELTAVKCDQKGNCVAAGYGILLNSSDNGQSWTRSNQEGDFYNSIEYNSKNTPYVVGYHGSILYSEDNGASWIHYKNAHSPLANNKPFRKIKFYNNIGFIVGDNGTIWKSTNDGYSWYDISIKTELDLIDFVIFEDQLFLASEAGKILTLDI